MKTLIAVGGVVAVLIAFVVGNYYSAYNYGADAETTIEAEYTNMENILANYGKKVKEAVQVPGMKADDLVRVTKEAMSGRYGDDGSQAAFQWIKENYPGQVSDATYTKVQQIIEAGRNKFENAQTKFIDTKRQYVAVLKKDLFLSKGWWMSISGYPKIDLDEFVIISSGHAQKAFEDKVEEAIELR